MNNNDDIMERLLATRSDLHDLAVHLADGGAEEKAREFINFRDDIADAISRIQSDSKRIAELEAEVKRLQDDLHAEKGFTEILLSEREPPHENQ